MASRACYGRTKLTSVTASSATSIGDDAFNGCASLSFFNDKNNSVKSATVGARAFADCRSLAQVTVAKAVTSIGEGVFQGCTGMTTLTLADGSFSSSKKIPKSAFRGCTSLTLYRRSASTETGTSYANYKFPKAITKIEDEAFYGCSSLTTVGLSENIEEIGQNIFGNIKLNALLFWCT
ncbi:MAG: leucine-rich repeat domain-containing protein [Clostridia bacterium]|nr:leucine-rich repeat domain-containing protein [Clostridia bacterium]